MTFNDVYLKHTLELGAPVWYLDMFQLHNISIIYTTHSVKARQYCEQVRAGSCCHQIWCYSELNAGYTAFPQAKKHMTKALN